MKNNPSSNPLKGSMSASSWWRYSLSASTTPARNVPSAADNPDELHEQRDAHDQHQRRRGEHLPQSRARDVAKQRPQRVPPAHDHRRHRRETTAAPCAQPGSAAISRPAACARQLVPPRRRDPRRRPPAAAARPGSG